MPRPLSLYCPILIVGLVAAASWGCSREEGIQRYTVPKPKPIKAVAADATDGQLPAGHPPIAGRGPMQSSAAGDRMFGAIILRGDIAWFVKATGTTASMTAESEKLLDFVKSLRFGGDGEPAWTLPEGWDERPGTQFRHRTFIAGPAASPLDISLSKLPKNDDDAPYILANVNRWRSQLDLPATDSATLERALIPIELADGQIAQIVILGRPGADVPAAALAVKYDVPQGWTDDGPQRGRKASLSVADGDRRLLVTVTSFSSAAPQIADPVSNINRWRREIGLAEVTSQDELDKIAAAVEGIDIDGRRSVYIELYSPDEAAAQRATFAAMFQDGGEVWFVKLTGDGSLAKREREAFKKLLESIRLEPAGETPKGAGDGE